MPSFLFTLVKRKDNPFLYRIYKYQLKAYDVAVEMNDFENLAENSPLLVWENSRLFALQKDIIDIFE